MTFPLIMRKSEDLYVSSYTQLTCMVFFSMTTVWSVKLCSGNCSILFHQAPTVITESSELFIPANLLPYGTYQLTFTVTIIASSNTTLSILTYVTIGPSNPIVNPIIFGTSMNSHGHRVDLTLDLPLFSIDPDVESLDASVSSSPAIRTLTLSLPLRIGFINTIAASMAFRIFRLFKDQC